MLSAILFAWPISDDDTLQIPSIENDARRPVSGYTKSYLNDDSKSSCGKRTRKFCPRGFITKHPALNAVSQILLNSCLVICAPVICYQTCNSIRNAILYLPMYTGRMETFGYIYCDENFRATLFRLSEYNRDTSGFLWYE